MKRAGLRRVGALATGAALVATVGLLAAGCTSRTSPSVSLPTPGAGAVTFYLSLPGSVTSLAGAAARTAVPGSAEYRHFSSLDAAAGRFGATDAQIATVAESVHGLGLQFAADPTRLFGRVSGTTAQWQKALGTPLSEQAATPSSPFTVYTLPAETPAALQPSGSTLLLQEAEVYDAATAGSGPPGGAPPTPSGPSAGTTATQPWPFNTGTPFTAGCSAPLLQEDRVYTPQQIQTAYGLDTTQTMSQQPVITVLDLGGGWLANDLEIAAECFGYTAPKVSQTQGDGVVTAIENADPETSLDLQTVSAIVPNAHLRLVQSTDGGLLDAFSRAVGDPAGLPDVISLSYGGCALAENQQEPAYTSAIDSVLAMATLTGVSTFVAAGDSGSTTCGPGVGETTLSFPAVSPFVTAVGGTRLALGPGNTRVSETVWNDSVFGDDAAGGGALSHQQPRPSYQDGVNPADHRAVPDVSALADAVPGWPVVVDSTLQTVGGTSGPTPFIAAATATVIASERHAGRPAVGLANGWFYAAASQPSAFFDVTTGSNDLAGVGCCQASVGYDLASGLGVPNWAVLPAALPPPG